MWIAYCDRDGYGMFTKNKGERPWGAHRLSWEITHGAVPAGLQVLHRCDMPCCVNPDHLFLGTNQDNMTDKCRKGREARGVTQISSAKLTEGQVRAIRADCRQQKEIAAAYGVSPANVSLIRSHQTWREVV